MNRHLAVYLVTVVVSGVGTGVPTAAAQQLAVSMSAEQIEEALQLANDDKAASKFLAEYVIQSRTGWGNGPLIGTFTTPFARVVRIAIAARKQGKSLTPSDISPDILAPELHVIASTQDGALGEDDSVAIVQYVNIIPRGEKDSAKAIQPSRTVDATKDYQRRYDLALPQSGIVAIFPLAVMSDDNEIHVVFSRMAKGSSASSMCKDCVVPFSINRIR